jgi:hypothetical protein
MTGRLGSLEICCDAPPYQVVRACERLGFRCPADVRWYRLDHLGPTAVAPGPASLWFWKRLLGWGRSREQSCSCGEPLPALEGCTFTLISEKEVQFRLGQCGRCRTIFWQAGGTP